ncbi:predicted protein, partial [Nematostella vectensis]
LPHFFVYVGWFGIAGVSFTSAFFVTLYGFQFGKEKASQWITSMTISFLQDVLISQPIKVFIIAVFFALFLKKLDDDDDDHEKLVIYVLFLGSLLVVSYAHRDPQAFQVARLMEQTYIDGAYTGLGLKQGVGTSNYWRWLENTVLPSLSSESSQWPTGCQPNANYSIDCVSRVVGTARLRQLRVPPGTCKVEKEMRHLISECNGYYSFFGEDTQDYFEGWIASNVTNKTMLTPWQHRSTLDLGGVPYMGLMATYSGGGYSFNLQNTDEGLRELSKLKEGSWIDERTRAIFLEISVYNAQANLFGIATFLTEWVPTNGIVCFNNIKVARLYVTGDGLEIATIVCKVLLLIFVLIFMYQEFKKIFKQRKAYLREVWNWMELALIVCVLGCAVTILQRALLVDIAIKKLNAQQNRFV